MCPRTGAGLHPVARFLARRLLLLVWTACGIGAAVRPPALQAQPSRFELRPLARIGDAFDPDQTLTRVGAVAVSGGRVYVSQPVDAQVRVFAIDGEFLRVLGGRGEGPGEFQALGAVGPYEGGIWATDLATERITYFAADDGYLRSVRLRRYSTASPGPMMALQVQNDGSLIATQNDPGATILPLLRFDAEGAFADTLLSLESPGFLERSGGVVLESESGAARFVALPARRHVLWSFAPDGSGTLVADPSPGRPEDRAIYQLLRVGVRGDTTLSQGMPYEPVSVLPSHAAQLAEAEVAGFPPDEARALRGSIRDFFEDVLDSYEYYPPVDRLLAGGDGTIWLRRRLGAMRREWLFLDAQARPLGVVDAAPGGELMYATRLHAWFRETDELDVPYLVRYELVRRRRRRA